MPYGYPWHASPLQAGDRVRHGPCDLIRRVQRREMPGVLDHAQFGQ